MVYSRGIKLLGSLFFSMLCKGSCISISCPAKPARTRAEDKAKKMRRRSRESGETFPTSERLNPALSQLVSENLHQLLYNQKHYCESL